MKDLAVVALTLTVLGTMFIATVRNGSTGTELARAEGYTSSTERVLDISMAQLGSTVPVRHFDDKYPRHLSTDATTALQIAEGDTLS